MDGMMSGFMPKPPMMPPQQNGPIGGPVAPLPMAPPVTKPDVKPVQGTTTPSSPGIPPTTEGPVGPNQMIGGTAPVMPGMVKGPRRPASTAAKGMYPVKK